MNAYIIHIQHALDLSLYMCWIILMLYSACVQLNVWLKLYIYPDPWFICKVNVCCLFLLCRRTHRQIEMCIYYNCEWDYWVRLLVCEGQHHLLKLAVALQCPAEIFDIIRSFKMEILATVAGTFCLQSKHSKTPSKRSGTTCIFSLFSSHQDIFGGLLLFLLNLS